MINDEVLHALIPQHNTLPFYIKSSIANYNECNYQINWAV